MRIDFNQKLSCLEGKPIKWFKTNEDTTLCKVCVEALLGNYQDETNNSTGEEKYTRYKLAAKIKESTSKLELKTEDVVKIKKLLGKAFNPLVVGRAYDLLEE